MPLPDITTPTNTRYSGPAQSIGAPGLFLTPTRNQKRQTRFTLDNLPDPSDFSEAFRACLTSHELLALHDAIDVWGWTADALLTYAHHYWSPKGRPRHATPSAYRAPQSSTSGFCGSMHSQHSPRAFVHEWKAQRSQCAASIDGAST